MDRQIPVFNKLVMNKIHHDNMQKHYKNLITIRKTKKVRPNAQNVGLSKANSKSMQLQEERKTEIDKNNVMLFQKMDRILKRDDPYNQTVGHRPNNKRGTNHCDRIYEENKKMVERLTQLKPTIDNKKLSQQRKKQLNILKFIGKYSPSGSSHLQNHMFRSKQSQRVGKTLENENRYRIKTQNFKGDDQEHSYKFMQSWNMNLRPKYNRQHNVFKRERNAEQVKQYIHSSLTNYQQQESSREVRVLTGHSQPQSRSINLFKTIKQVDQASFCICITRTHDHYQISLEEICEEGQCFRLELQEEKGKELLQAIDYDYQYLVDRLYIEDGQLAIQQDLSTYKEDSRSREMNRVTPQAKVRRISQMFLPSHITEQNQEEFSLHQQTTFLKNQPQNNENQVDENENKLQQQQSPIKEHFQSFGNSHQIEDC